MKLKALFLGTVTNQEHVEKMAFIAKSGLCVKEEIKAAGSGQSGGTDDHGPIRMLEEVLLHGERAFPGKLVANFALLLVIEAVVDDVKTIHIETLLEAEHFAEVTIEQQAMGEPIKQ